MSKLSPSSQLVANRFISKMHELGYTVKDCNGNQTFLTAWLRGDQCIEFRISSIYADTILMIFHTANMSGRHLTIDEVEMLNPSTVQALHDCISAGKAKLKEQAAVLRAMKQQHTDAVYDIVKHLPGK